MARSLVVVVLVVFLLAGCHSSVQDHSNDGRLPVCVGIPPLAYLVEQIGGEHVKVDTLIRPSQDPHTFEPTPQQVLALGKATLFFKIDMPFETVLLEKLQKNNRRLKVVDTTFGIRKRPTDNSHCDHHHPTEAGVPDPHVWLSPPLLMIQAENITGALCEADPTYRQDYQKNLAILLDRLDALHQNIEQRLAPYRGRSFYVFHPGFGYFADAYGLKEEAVEADGREPAPRALNALVEKARSDGVKTIFIQQQIVPSSARVIAEALGGQVVQINGLGKNVIEDIEDIANKVENSFKRNSPRRHGEHGEKQKIMKPQMNTDEHG